MTHAEKLELLTVVMVTGLTFVVFAFLVFCIVAALTRWHC